MKFFLIILISCSTVGIFAQDSTRVKPIKPLPDQGNFWDHCYSGGDLSFFGGSGQIFFNISPLLGYRPGNKGFSYGIGATYQFTRINYYGYSDDYSLYGIRAFVRQQLGNMFFVHGELENYYTKGYNIFTRKEEPISIPCANICLGYRQKFSEFSYSYLMVGYEMIGDQKAGSYVYYTHPIVIKAGYIIDLKGK
jgi:hypothetical protein